MTHLPPPSAGPPSLRPPSPSILQRVQRSPATFGLIGVTALVFAAQLLGQALAGADVVLYYGAKINERLAAGEAWRLVTPIFLHAGLLHIGVNMYSLWALGPAVERFFGHGRFLAVYLLSGMSGVLLSLVMSPNPSVGASGAIFGLLGALAAFLYLHRATFGQFGAMQLRQLLFVALINLGLGLSPGIDNWGHVGGLLAGAGAGVVPRAALFHDRAARRPPDARRRAPAGAADRAPGAGHGGSLDPVDRGNDERQGHLTGPFACTRDGQGPPTIGPCRSRFP